MKHFQRSHRTLNYLEISWSIKPGCLQAACSFALKARMVTPTVSGVQGGDSGKQLCEIVAVEKIDNDLQTWHITTT